MTSRGCRWLVKPQPLFLLIIKPTLEMSAGNQAPPGLDAFSNMIAAHGLCINKE